MQTEFGSGTLWAVPTINLAGNNIAAANATPVPFGAMQDVSVDFSATVKELFGLYQFPIDVARGTVKISGKAKVARFQAELFNQLFGETLSSQETRVAYQESANISANNATVTLGANFYADLGVIYASNGTRLTRVAANAAAGEYVANANGLYTFNAANNTQVYISYAYTANNSSGNSWTINNQLLGLSPFFSVYLNQVRRGKHMTLILNRCVSTKITVATKLEDFSVPEFDFSAMADDSGVVGKWSLAEP
jgi:hypothetical protein